MLEVPMQVALPLAPALLQLCDQGPLIGQLKESPREKAQHALLEYVVYSEV